MQDISGVVILNKGEGLTSQAAVNRVKRLFSADKAGHTGTLDPMATGVLPILLGRGVKCSEYLLSSQKHYRAGLRLGITTDTEDSTGRVLTTTDCLPPASAVQAVLDRFRGDILQVPPMYSALKRNGRKLVDLARSGITVERSPRPVTVFSLTAERVSESDYSLDVICSKGTYIRTLCADIGQALGCGGIMFSLCRQEAAGFSLDDSHTLDELEKMTPEERAAAVIPVEALFQDCPIVRLPAFFARLASSGCQIYQKKVGTDFPVGTLCRFYTPDGRFFALARVTEFPDGSAIKPEKQFGTNF